MVCDNCGEEVQVSKSLKKGGENPVPDECPNCGEKLDDRHGDRLEKGV